MTPAARAVDRENPWPGLAAFEEGDEAFFKGREDETTSLLRLVLREDLTLLWGFSGLGKTSLLRAGLFPRLRAADVFPIYIRLRYDSTDSASATGPDALPTLVEQCLQAIRGAADLWKYEAPAPPQAPTLWEYARRRDARFWAPNDKLVTPLLVFDQFEELFARTRSEADWAIIDTFLRDLASTITGSPPEWLLDAGTPARSEQFLFGSGVFKVMLSFREDFLARVASLGSLVRGIDHNYFRLRAMTFDQALAVVKDAGGHLIDAPSPDELLRICQSIVARVANAPTPASQTSATVDPGLLSLFCRELNERRRHQSKAAIDRELVDSAAAGLIIAQFYESSMASVSAATRAFVEDRLVLSESRSRDSVPEEIARRAGASDAELALLIQKRILRRDEVTRGSRTIARLELTHDVLLEPALAAHHRRVLVKEERERRERAEEATAAAERDAQHQRLELAAFRAQEKARSRKRVIGVLAAVLVAFGAVVAIKWRSSTLDRAAEHERLLDATIERAVDDASAGRPADALARLATVLRQQPANAALRSLTLDLLMRRTWLVPVTSVSPTAAPFADVEFNFRGSLLAAVTRAGGVELLEVDTGRRLGATLPPNTAEARVAFSQDDAWLVTESASGRVAVWNGVTLAPIAVLPATGPVKAFALQPAPGASGGREVTVATWSEDGLVRTWTVDRRGARESRRFAAGSPAGCPASAGLPACLDFSWDGARMVTRSGATATVWDAATGRRLWAAVAPGGQLTFASFNPDGQTLVGGGQDGRVYLWDALAGRLAAQTPPDPGPVTTAAFNRDGLRLLTTFRRPETSVQPNAVVWTIGSGNGLSSQARTLDRPLVLRPAEAQVHGAFADDAVLITLSDGGHVRLVDGRSGAPLGTPLPVAAVTMHLDRRRDNARRRLAVVDRDGVVRVWVLRPPAPTSDLFANGAMFSAQFGDGTHVLTASADGTARVWDLTTGYVVRELLHDAPVVTAEYSTDRDLILTSTGKLVQVWNTATGERLVGIGAEHDAFIAAHFDRSATHVVTASPDARGARVWDAKTGQLTRAFPEARDLWSAEFDETGGRIVTASKGGTADVWDVATGARVGGPFRHAGEVVSARFSHDGSRVVTACTDRTAKVWMVDGTAPPIPLMHLESVTSAQFGSDSQHVITTSADATARIWTLGQPSPSVITLSHDAPVDFAELDSARQRLLTVSSRTGDIRMWDAVSGKAISRTLTSQSAVWVARFSPDGQRIVAASAAQGGRVFSVPSGSDGDASWLATLAESIAGLRADDRGAIGPADDPGGRLREFRAAADAATDGSFKSRFLRWFFRDDPAGL